MSIKRNNEWQYNCPLTGYRYIVLIIFVNANYSPYENLIIFHFHLHYYIFTCKRIPVHFRISHSDYLQIEKYFTRFLKKNPSDYSQNINDQNILGIIQAVCLSNILYNTLLNFHSLMTTFILIFHKQC